MLHMVDLNLSYKPFIAICVVFLVFTGVGAVRMSDTAEAEYPGPPPSTVPAYPREGESPRHTIVPEHIRQEHLREESAAQVPSRLDPLKRTRLEAQRALAGALERERQMMLEKVQLLTPEEAVRWARGFITAPPVSCPPSQCDLWLDAIIRGVRRNNLPLCKELVGLTACIISLESGFRADPPMLDPSGKETMADVLARAEREVQLSMGRLLSIPPIPRYYAAYRAKYYPLLLACKTEGDVEAVAEAMTEDIKRDLADLPRFLRDAAYERIDDLSHVVRTKGSMQLSFIRAKRVMEDRGSMLTDWELSDYMYTREGGIDVGIAALAPMFIQYAARYATKGDLSWLFFVGMDYHYGPFSSRNMMEQIRIRDLSGIDIPIDGDLLYYSDDGRPEDRSSQTLRAAQSFLTDLDREQIFSAFLLEKDRHYIYTDVHQRIRAEHTARAGPTPFAVIGDLWMGHAAEIKHGARWRTRSYFNKLDRYLNAVPWTETGSRNW